jgi:hypothetical protein
MARSIPGQYRSVLTKIELKYGDCTYSLLRPFDEPSFPDLLLPLWGGSVDVRAIGAGK